MTVAKIDRPNRQRIRPKNMMRVDRDSLRFSMSACFALAYLFSPGLFAEIRVDSSSQVFYKNATAMLGRMKDSPDPEIRKLYQEVSRASVTVHIRPFTDDSRTWHVDGDRTRAHTEALDNLGRGRARNRPTSAAIYLTTESVDPTRTSWKGGVLPHEMTHAMDLASGRYNKDYKIRERRAIVFQNIWRARVNKTLREDYHGSFDTLDYQNAKRAGTLGKLTEHIFSSSDLPSSRDSNDEGDDDDGDEE